jgi:hypothetical protein
MFFNTSFRINLNQPTNLYTKQSIPRSEPRPGHDNYATVYLAMAYPPNCLILMLDNLESNT